MNLENLEKEIVKDLKKLNYPPKPWMIENEGIYDVVIIGAGMAGMAAAFALLKLGISKIRLFDANEKGKEGPWNNFARMKTLRSPKQWMGPAMGIPSLTFHSWYEAQWGTPAWENLGKIPTALWMEYLAWYRKVLHLPVQNGTKLLAINPTENHLKLHFPNETVSTFKVVLATGRAGFGGIEIPDFIHVIPKSKWVHTNELIDFTALKGKRIAVIGAGAAGFDAAAVALENHAASVDMHIRRDSLPNVNTERELFYRGNILGFYHLSDQERWNYYSHSFKKGIPPPREALERLAKHPQFHFHFHTEIETILHQYDFLILATGYAIDGNKQPEIQPFMDQILLWKDRGFSSPAKMGRFPYLGPNFEFLEKTKGKASFLREIYCFNYAATLSHAGLGSEIPPISDGAERLAQGIALDFFLRNKEAHYAHFKNYNTPEFEIMKFPFFPI